MFVHLKDLDIVIHATDLLPQATLFHNDKAAAQNVAHVAASTYIRRQWAVWDCDPDRACVVKHDKHFLNSLRRRFDFFDRHFYFVGKLLPRYFDVKSARVRAKLGPNIHVHLYICLCHEVLHCIFESIGVAGRRAIVEPGDAFEANTDINDFYFELFAWSVMECLVLHEYHVSDLEASNEVLDWRSNVTNAGPYVFYEGNVVWVDSKCLREPPEVEFDTLFFEEFVVGRLVENLDTEHNESRVVATCEPDIVQIIEVGTELRADKRVSRRIKLTSYAVRLETENSSRNIVSSTGHNRVPLDWITRNTSTRQTRFESLPSFCECDLNLLLE